MAEILVEFVPDFSKLEAGVDQLVGSNTISKEMAALFTDAGKSLDQFGAKFEKLGVGVALKPAIDATKKAINDLSKSGIKDLGELKKRVDGITDSFIEGFGEGVHDALKETGVPLDEFSKRIKKNEEQQKTLRSTLSSTNEQLALMRLNGEQNSEQYKILAEQAGKYQNALSNVRQETAQVASDTRKLDTAIQFVTGLTAAFSVLQGARALFGKDNEQIQKTLLKVNAAMSILMGLQQIQAVLEKSSLVTKAVAAAQDKVRLISLNLETAAQSKNIIVKNAAIIAQRALNAVMSANPAFLLIAAFTALAGALVLFSGDTKDAKKEVEDFNDELERTNTVLDRSIDKIKEAGALRIAELKAQGKEQADISKEEAKIIAEQADVIAENIKKRNEELSKAVLGRNEVIKTSLRRLGITQEDFNKLTNEGVNNVDDALTLLNKVKAVKTSDAWSGFDEKTKANNTLIENMLNNLLGLNRTLEGLGTEQIKRGFEEAERQREEAEKKRKDAADKAEKDRRDREQKEKEARQAAFDDFVAKQKLRLIEVEKGSKEETQIKKDILRAELQSALNNDKLTFNQRKLLIQQFFATQKELTKQLNEENRKRVVEEQINNIKTELNAIRLSGDERLRLTIEQLEIEKAEELRLVVNNESKRAEIISRFDKEIFELRKKSRQDAFNEELEETKRNFAQKKSLLESNADDEKLPFEKRKEAIQELSSFEFSEFTKRRLENQKQLRNKEIDEKEFSKKAQEINNEEAEAKKKSEEKITGIVKDENAKRLKHIQETVAAVADFANQAIGALKGFLDTIAANEDNRIAAQRDSLERLRENGVISQKEYEARLKVIDRLDRTTKQKQAEREKAIALFEAFVNGAAAIIKAAPNVPLIVATSVLVAAQIAAIAARQLPKFGKGVKSAPKGFAEVGETGTELIQMNGKYFVADHPQVIWMKGGERVYNPNETKDILTPQANMNLINISNNNSHDKAIDYDKIAKKIGEEIARHPRSVTNFDEDGVKNYIITGLDKQKYLNKRFTF